MLPDLPSVHVLMHMYTGLYPPFLNEDLSMFEALRDCYPFHVVLYQLFSRTFFLGVIRWIEGVCVRVGNKNCNIASLRPDHTLSYMQLEHETWFAGRQG